MHGEVHAAYALSEIAQLYAVLLHRVAAGCDPVGTDRPQRAAIPRSHPVYRIRTWETVQATRWTNPVRRGRMAVKVRDADTAGAYSIHDNIIPPGSPEPRPHLHRDHEEAFYVLEGELHVRVGPRTITAPAGSFVVVPRGVVHQPSNPGTEPTRVLLVFSPSGMGGFFEEAAERRMPLQVVPSDPAVLEELEVFTEKYGYEFAEFPPDP
jgi:mannose-6-phosphate isomerase-like protein (cupin superfamily)